MLIAGLVVLLMVIGVPLVMPGMSGSHCANCSPATPASTMCLAVLAAAAALLVVGSRRIRPLRAAHRELIRSVFFHPPPQLASVR